jgi:hypothetical protein
VLVVWIVFTAACAAPGSEEKTSEPTEAKTRGVLEIPQALDFGKFVRAGESRGGHFVNDGPTAVVVESVEFDGPSGFDVHLSKDDDLVEAPVVLEPGEQMSFLVICTSSVRSQASGQVIVHTDEDAAPYLVDIGRIDSKRVACLEVEPSRDIDFGDVAVGRSQAVTIRLRDCAGSDRRYRIDSDSLKAGSAQAAFTFAKLADQRRDRWVPWNPRKPLELQVEFAPEKVGEVNATRDIKVAVISHQEPDCGPSWYGQSPDVWKKCSMYEVVSVPVRLEGHGIDNP